MIFVHDLDEALKIGSRIAIMEAGRIIQVGTPEQIVMNPGTDYVRQFVAHVNPLNVLRSGTLLRSIANLRREGDTVSDGRVSLGLDFGGRPETATVDGRPVRIAPITNGAGPPDPASYDVAIAPVDTMLQATIRPAPRFRQPSGARSTSSAAWRASAATRRSTAPSSATAGTPPPATPDPAMRASADDPLPHRRRARCHERRQDLPDHQPGERRGARRGRDRRRGRGRPRRCGARSGAARSGRR